MKACPSVLSALEKLASSPSSATAPELRVVFPDGTAISQPGVKLSSVPTRDTPALSLASALVRPHDGDKYLALCIDLDAPFPSFSPLGPIAHWVQSDLVAAAAAAAGAGSGDDDDGFRALEPQAQSVMPYVGPGPPRPSAPHRYVFMLWEQPPAVGSAEAVREALSLPDEAGLMARIRWDQSLFETKMGLGEPLAVNYFVASSE